MKFIEVVNADTGGPVLINLALVSHIRPRNDNGRGSVFVLASGETIVTAAPVSKQAARLLACGVLS